MAMKSAKRPTGNTKKHVEEAVSQLKDTKRLNINVPKNKYRALKIMAAEQDTTVTQLVIDAVSEKYSLSA